MENFSVHTETREQYDKVLEYARTVPVVIRKKQEWDSGKLYNRYKNKTHVFFLFNHYLMIGDEPDLEFAEKNYSYEEFEKKFLKLPYYMTL